ncbi:MAG: CHASE2 domain-containing protein, partial [Proteobacteria bacterium]|nr:CHASE2 domain-containing protein [Pseudomonadota bacterium]
AFERPTEPPKDHALVDSIQKSTLPIVLAAIDERARVATSRSLEYQDSFFGDVGASETGRVRAGHAFFSRVPDRLTTGDQVVRFISAPLNSTPTRESFARVLAELDGEKPKPASPYIDWLLPPLNGEEIFATVRVPEHKPVAGNDSDSATVIPSYLKPLLKNKIVLVGAEFVDRDRHLTPLSVADRQAVPGVTIHAQILAQLRDGRSIGELSAWQQLLAVFALALVGYILGWRARLHQYGTATHFFSVVGLAVAGAVLFARAHLIIPTTLLFFGWLAGVIGGHYSGPFLRWFAGSRGAKDA